MIPKEEITDYFKSLQDQICDALERCDGKAEFEQDLWERESGGGGRTRIIQHGNIFEKGGVNFSAVHGELPENIAKALKLDATSFYATGVSIVIHPSSPMIPIIHMNVRYFEMENTWWFGGGIDLTPIYVDEQDAKFFHQQMKNSCDQFDASYYPKFKQWADDYFYIKHRKETRGIGGIFFDRLTANDIHTKTDIFNFVKTVGESFAPTYTEIVKRNSAKTFQKHQKDWQLQRRGRYVEFNLVYDKGTKFGLDTDGRVESILMSLPELASWQYNVVPEKGSPEAKTQEFLRKGVNWLT